MSCPKLTKLYNKRITDANFVKKYHGYTENSYVISKVGSLNILFLDSGTVNVLMLYRRIAERKTENPDESGDFRMEIVKCFGHTDPMHTDEKDQASMWNSKFDKENY